MQNKSKEQLISFTQYVMNKFNEGELPYIIHLSGGNENELIDIFKQINTGDYILSTHRSHYHYLLSGGSEHVLYNKIKDGKSMFVFDKELNFLTSSILAGTAGIAAGIAMGIQLNGGTQKVWCFIGDGAEDEGHFYEAVRFVDSMKLPCKFIIEDNNKSVESTREMRNSRSIINWPDCVVRYNYIHNVPHCGSGTKDKIIFNKNIIADYFKNN